MTFKVKIWKAKEVTKFYQVLTFISPSDYSFAVHHYGPNSAFIGLGKVTLGQFDVTTVSAGTNAGLAKIRQKSKTYVNEVENKELEFRTRNDLDAWLKTHFADKQRQAVRTLMVGSAEFNMPAATPDPPSTSREPDEPDHIKHPEWGSW